MCNHIVIQHTFKLSELCDSLQLYINAYRLVNVVYPATRLELHNIQSCVNSYCLAKVVWVSRRFFDVGSDCLEHSILKALGKYEEESEEGC
jgi:hypothetical protein